MTTSVALCTYNGEKYLHEQMDSILDQSILPDEIIICDDISKDSTVKIINVYQTKYPNIRLFINEQNLGFIKNFEKAINLCSKEIILICDQDDLWEKNKIENIKIFFNENPTFDGVFHDMKLLDENEKKPSYLNWKNIDHREIITDISNKKIFATIINRGSFILGCSLALKKEALDKYNIKHFPFAHDLFIAQKLSAYNTLGFITKTLSSYRLHENQVYGLRYKSEKKEEKKISDVEKFFKDEVWTRLNILEKYKVIRPADPVENTIFYQELLVKRNLYLKSLPFLERKKYIAKCIRHRYLYLNFTDLFKL